MDLMGDDLLTSYSRSQINAIAEIWTTTYIDTTLYQCGKLKKDLRSPMLIGSAPLNIAEAWYSATHFLHVIVIKSAHCLKISFLRYKYVLPHVGLNQGSRMVSRFMIRAKMLVLLLSFSTLTRKRQRGMG